MSNSAKFSLFLPILALLLASGSSLAEITINKTCSTKGVTSSGDFLLQAEKISISVGSFDRENLAVFPVGILPLSSVTCARLSAMMGTYVDVAIPRVITSVVGLETWGTMEFFTNTTDPQGTDGAWRLSGLTVYISNNATGEAYGKRLTTEEVDSLGLEGNSIAQGYKCPSTHIRLGKSNAVDIENLRLFPFLSTGRVPTDDDYVECVTEGHRGGGLPWWGIVLIIFGAVVVVGAVATGGFALYRARRGA